MSTEEIFQAIETKISEIQSEYAESLERLNERAKLLGYGKQYDTKFSVPDSYYKDIAIHAHAIRGGKIALINLRECINQLKAKAKQ